MARHMGDLSQVWRLRLVRHRRADVSNQSGWLNAHRDTEIVSFYGPYATKGAAKVQLARERKYADYDNAVHRRVPDGPGWVTVSGKPQLAETVWEDEDGGGSDGTTA